MRTCIIGFALLFTASLAVGITITGTALLEDETNHFGIQVKFDAVSPSAEADSVFTNTSGHFAVILEPGVYDVTYSHDGFYSVVVAGLLVSSSAELDQVLLSSLTSTLAGVISGVIGPGDYLVIDYLTIEANDTLTILPGTILRFNEDTGILIEGHVSAIGMETDSILFTASSSNADSNWKGFTFNNGSTELSYCLIEYCRKSSYGGFAYLDYRTLFSLSHSTLRHNSTSGQGGAILCNSRDASIEPILIESCHFENNSTDDIGAGGALDIAGPAIIRNSVFTGNEGNGGGAASIEGNVLIEGCLFFDNAAFVGGGAVEAYGNVTIDRCTFIRNQATFLGAGLQCWSSGIECTNSVFVDHMSKAIIFSNAADCEVRFCDFIRNRDGNFGYRDDDSAHGPLGIGVILTQNINGTPCDTYYNIFEDPLFVDTENGNFHLLEDSPCIDAGDPDLPHDPDGTIADIGAFYYPQTQATDNSKAPLPTELKLYQNYPNPFNAATQIRFDLPLAGNVQLKLFDIQGRQVTELLNRCLVAGNHTVELNGNNLATGVYFYQIISDNRSQTRKMILMK